MPSSISPDRFRERKAFVEVHGRRMAVVDEGEGPATVLLHGNPTSSFLWREVMPHLEGRVVAPDLIGMGDSDKLEGTGDQRYRFVEHARYLEELLAALDLGDDITLVIHDWGSALGFDWARRHADRVSGIAFMEAICAPLSIQDWPEAGRNIFATMRSEAGEAICLEKNVFVERILPSSIMRDLDDEEMNEYRRPFTEPGEARRPTLTWPREIPFDAHPEDVHHIVTAYDEWLRSDSSPRKLWIKADPGFLTDVFTDEIATWSHLDTVTVPGLHFVQEDSGEDIGRAVADWQ